MNFVKVSGVKIKQAIKEIGLTQEQFAKKMNLKPQVISRWVKEGSNIKEANLKKIAKETGKQINYFFKDTDGINQYIGNSNTNIKQSANENELYREALKNRLDRIDKDIEILKVKIDLLIEKVSDK